MTPSEIFKRIIVITTSGVFSDPPLLCSLAELGEDKILYSVDHPFEMMAQAAEWFDNAPISEEISNKISWSNATQLMNL